MSASNEKFGQYTLAHQVGQRAYFARVHLKTSLVDVDGGGLVVNVNPDVDERWHTAVRFGVFYAWEHAIRGAEALRASLVDVVVMDVDWQPADSTAMTVVFATAQATWNALEFKPDEAPTFDASSAQFVFPN